MNCALTWDESKRATALRDRGLDFADEAEVFAHVVFEFEDIRRDYGERRILCFGLLAGRLVAVGYVQRAACRHIFSMRKANEREQKRFG
jgi:uncharacterized DUF497 family protein